jgi:hypothetical protein
MSDVDILHHITELVNEEHHLDQRAAAEGGLTDEEHARMQDLKVALDQCWDLLRRRRARRSTGGDPDSVEVRDASTVEHYQQ